MTKWKCEMHFVSWGKINKCRTVTEGGCRERGMYEMVILADAISINTKCQLELDACRRMCAAAVSGCHCGGICMADQNDTSWVKDGGFINIICNNQRICHHTTQYSRRDDITQSASVFRRPTETIYRSYCWTNHATLPPSPHWTDSLVQTRYIRVLYALCMRMEDIKSAAWRNVILYYARLCAIAMCGVCSAMPQIYTRIACYGWFMLLTINN